MLHEESISYKPFKYQWAYDLTQTHEIELHWHEKEVNLQQDIQQWNDGTITEQEREFIKDVLRLFTQSDVAVGRVYKDYLIPYFKNNEVSNLLTAFAAREGLHQRAYALIPESLNFEEKEWHAFLEYAHMKKKWELMTAPPPHMYPIDIAVLLAKTVFMEGVSLFGSFSMLLEFKKNAKMLGMCEVVEWSIRDESLHVEGNARLFRQFCAEHPYIDRKELQRRIYDTLRELVKQERVFLSRALVKRGDIGGALQHKPLDGDVQNTYIRFIEYLADRRLIQLGYKGIYNVRQMPEGMQWFDEITTLPREANFFERRVTDYADEALVGEIDWER